MTPTTSRSPGGSGIPLILGLLSVFGPVSMDIYLPVLPQLADRLDASPAAAQLTVTACLIGLALGQIVAGPLSDRFGRRRPMLVGVSLFTLVSLACAAAPTIEILIGLRFLQGAAGAAGIVIAQATGRDIYSGSRLVRYYGRLTVITGLAAILGPVAGGALSAFVDWRGVFGFLAAIGAVILGVGAWAFRETLPAAERTGGGPIHTLRTFAGLLRDRRFVAVLLTAGFVNAAMFSYIGGATFLLQDVYGLSPRTYALVFGLNSTGFMMFGFLAGRGTERWSEHVMLRAGLALCAAGAGGLVVAGVLELSMPYVVVALFLLVSGVATTAPPSVTLAVREHPQTAGTAASLLGVSRYLFGGLAAPLVGLFPQGTALPLGVVTAGATVGAMAMLALSGRAERNRVRWSAAAPDRPRRPSGCCSGSSRSACTGCGTCPGRGPCSRRPHRSRAATARRRG